MANCSSSTMAWKSGTSFLIDVHAPSTTIGPRKAVSSTSRRLKPSSPIRYDTPHWAIHGSWVANCSPAAVASNCRYSTVVSANCTVITAAAIVRANPSFARANSSTSPTPAIGSHNTRFSSIGPIVNSDMTPAPEQRAHDADHDQQRIQVQTAGLRSAQQSRRSLRQRRQPVQ